MLIKKLKLNKSNFSSISKSICLITSIVLQVLIVLVGSENTLKVCTKQGKVHEVSTSKCSRGAWTANPIEVDCICAKGLWILSEKFCDKEFYIIASREDECFKINRPIRRFLSLMNDDNFNSGDMYFFNGNLENFRPFQGNLSLQSVPDASYVVRFNDTEYPLYLRHEEGVSKKFWQKCFKPVVETESFQVVKSDGASFVSSWRDCDQLKDLKFGYGKSEKNTWELTMGSMWHSKYGLESFSTSCMTSCSPLRETDSLPQGRRMPGENGTNSNETDSQAETNGIGLGSPSDIDNIIEDSLEDNTVPEDAYDSNLEDVKDFKDEDVMREKLLDNGRDTIRIIHHLKKWIMHSIEGPKVPYKEYKYLQLARIIFLKSCPEVDGQTLTNFIRLFRFLIHESLNKSPDKYPEMTDERVHARIVETLRKCFNSVTEYKFEYDMEACPGKDGPPILNVIAGNGTKYPPKINSSDTDDLMFKTSKKSDTVLETAWKIMLHAHYQCAEEFQEHPDDLSVMYIKLQDFLVNPRIIFRWEHPGEYLNKVYGFVHPGFKLHKFAATVDACVNAAKESSFFKEWLRRPKDQQDFREEAVMGRSMVLLKAKGSDIPKFFNGKGYCVNKFEDPLTWTNVNDAVNAKC